MNRLRSWRRGRVAAALRRCWHAGDANLLHLVQDVCPARAGKHLDIGADKGLAIEGDDAEKVLPVVDDFRELGLAQLVPDGQANQRIGDAPRIAEVEEQRLHERIGITERDGGVGEGAVNGLDRRRLAADAG